MKNTKFSLQLLVLGTSLFALSACGTTQSQNPQSNSSKIDSALERAAVSAAASGETSQSMSYVEKLYKRNSSDPDAAIAYAKALREADYLSRAALVLEPFAKDSKGPVQAKTEYAALQLAQGNYEAAEEYAKKAVLQDEKNHEAYHYLGIALDAQAMHPEAERAFRKALDYWQGDPTTVMNNLALNLASQNFLDEAAEILYKAQAIAPDRMEIERNLRIVLALQQADGRNAPKPQKKPEARHIEDESKEAEAGPEEMPKAEPSEVTVESITETSGPRTASEEEKPAKTVTPSGND